MDLDDEVVIFKGRKLARIYDGVRVEPIEEIARFTIDEFFDNADQIADEYEDW